ncbi:putative ubiquitin-conjugating enzyme E2 39 [Capsicum annuum]|uniref:Ubiquitin-conjugating enzyme E2 39 n=1 Tax=Capsicum annuum TaxID=4072 RepID=A0A2G2YB18_CAPAN|nr:putative ubiquitin-conjugating enzyme E2 39 [Capsicum annuum]
MAAIVSGESKKSATTSKFPHFDVVSDESDHYYVKSNQSSKDKKCFIDTNTSAYRTIMKEWKILEKQLPESIYVRTYESRMDLLRAVIVGAAGTPYHDGLFFFDIVFPSDYPKQPPKVRYLSRGYHMNPNLYPDGYVLVSTLSLTSTSLDTNTTSKTRTSRALFIISTFGEFILSAVDAYGNGNATAGHYQVNNPPSSRVHNSAQFQKNSKKMLS